MNTAIARDWSENQLVRAGSPLGRRIRAGLQAMQYAQMIAVLNRLPDTYLEQAELRRCDIPEHARRAVYGAETAHRPSRFGRR